jgi:hypothetical protein
MPNAIGIKDLAMPVEVKSEHNKIWLHITDRKSESYVGCTDYNDELFKIVSSVSWHVKKSHYIYSSQYKKYLHQVVMEYWYGQECCQKMYENGFVIDHLDNNGLNCQYENLEFLWERKNLHLKGNVFDKTQREQIPIAAVSIYKRRNGEYQITIGFNKPFYNSNGQAISRGCLVYRARDYDLVLNDALLVQDFLEKGTIAFKDLHNDDFSWDPVYQIVSDKDLRPGNVVNGFMVMGDGVLIIKAAPDKSL